MFRLGLRHTYISRLYFRPAIAITRQPLPNQPYDRVQGIKTIVAKPAYVKPLTYRSLTENLPRESEPSSQSPDLYRKLISNLEAKVIDFDERSHRYDRADEMDFVRTFDKLTSTVETLETAQVFNSRCKNKLSLLSGILLRSCGRLMDNTPNKHREMLAGNLWTFIKEKDIPLDISHFNSLIKCFIENGTKFDPKKVLEEIDQLGLTPDRLTYQRLIHQYCIQANINEAASMLEKMKELSMDLSESIFSTLIIGYGKQENPPSPEEMFQLIRNSGFEPGSASYAAALISELELIEKGIDRGFLKDLIKEIQQNDVRFASNDLTDVIDRLVKIKEKNEDASNFLNTILQSHSGATMSKRRIYNSLLKSNHQNLVSEIFWRDLDKDDLRRYREINSYLRLLISSRKVPFDHMMSEISKALESTERTNLLLNVWHAAAQCGDIQVVRASINLLADREPIKSHLFYPLLARTEDKKELVDILNEIEQKLGPLELVDTMMEWVWGKFSDSYTYLMNDENIKVDKRLLAVSYLKYLAVTKRVDKLLEMLSDNNVAKLIESVDPMKGDLTRSIIYEYNRVVKFASSQTKDLETLETLLSRSKTSGSNVDRRSLQPFILDALRDNNIAKALELFNKFHEDYGVVPARLDLIRYCLATKDEESLQKVISITTKVLGEDLALYDLADCCIRNGKLKQAQKIYSSPGFEPMTRRVYRTAQHLAETGLDSELHEFIKMNMNFITIDIERLYLDILEVYNEKSDTKRVLELWNTIQEFELQASGRVMRRIARILARNNVEVPFRY